MTKNNVTALELGFMIFLITIAGKVHALPSMIAGYSNESLWVSALICFVLDFILLLIVIKILNGIKGRDFYEVLIEYFGKFLGKTICFLMILFMIAKIFIPIIEQKNSIELTFYETQPTLFTFIPVYIVIFYIALKGAWSFCKSINIVVWGFIVGVVIVLVLSISAANPEQLLPFFAVKTQKVLNGSFKSLLWFGDPLFLLFFSKYLSKDEKITKRIVISYLLSVLVYILGLMIFYSIFENIAVRQYFAPLKMSKYSVTLSNIGRFDYLATLLIIMANVYELALPLVIASSLTKSLFSIKNKYLAPLIICALSLTITLLTQHGFYQYLDVMQNYGIWFLLVITYVIPIIMFIKNLLLRRKNERI